MSETHTFGTTDHQYDTLVLIPAYNAEIYLEDLIRRVREFVCDSNLLIVNDGSDDNTENILRDLGVAHITFERNRGKGAALAAGFDHAISHGYRSVLTMDADLQHLPEEVPRFFAGDNGRRVLIGTRTIARSVMPFERWLVNNLTSLIISVFSCRRIRDSQSGYRLLPTLLLKAARLTTVRYDLESQLLFQAGALRMPVEEVPITTVYDGSHSFINPLIDTGRFIRQIWLRIWL